MSLAEKSRLDASNRDSGGKQASREGSVGNKEGVGFQEQVGGAAGDRKDTGGGKGGEEEARSSNIIGAIKQALGIKTKPGEMMQRSNGGRSKTGPGASRRGFHVSSGLDVGTKEPPQDQRHHPRSNVQKTDHPESPSDRVYKRETDRAKEAADKSYEPDRPSGGEEDLRYGGRQNWSRESGSGKGVNGRDEGPGKGSAGGRKPERR